MPEKALLQAVLADEGRLPADQDRAALTESLLDALGSPDAELRDGLAFRLLALWLSNDAFYDADALLRYHAQLLDNLSRGLGESGTDSALLRSFSALTLAVLTERDARQPFLHPDAVRADVAHAADYLRAEQDLRGYDARVGWVHAVSHTAAWMQALAQHPATEVDALTQIMDAVADRLLTPHPAILHHDEDERLAAAVLEALHCEYLHYGMLFQWAQRFRAWVDAYDLAAPFDPARYAISQNVKRFVRSLYVRLDKLDEPSIAMQKLRDELRDLARAFSV